SLECDSRAADGPSKGAPLAPYPLLPAAIDAVVGNEVGNVFFLARELLIRAAHLRDPRECGLGRTASPRVRSARRPVCRMVFGSRSLRSRGVAAGRHLL